MRTKLCAVFAACLYRIALYSMTLCPGIIPFSIDSVTGLLFNMLSALAQKESLSGFFIFKMLPAFGSGEIGVQNGRNVMDDFFLGGGLELGNNAIKYLHT